MSINGEIDEADLKSTLKGLLISSPKTFTVSELQAEFRKCEEYEFPFKALGFDSFRDYLLSIDDAIEIVNIARYDPIVRPVVDKKTEHINKMVCEQKYGGSPYRKRQESKEWPTRNDIVNNVYPRMSRHRAPPLMSLRPSPADSRTNDLVDNISSLMSKYRGSSYKSLHPTPKDSKMSRYRITAIKIINEVKEKISAEDFAAEMKRRLKLFYDYDVYRGAKDMPDVICVKNGFVYKPMKNYTSSGSSSSRSSNTSETYAIDDRRPSTLSVLVFPEISFSRECYERMNKDKEPKPSLVRMRTNDESGSPGSSSDDLTSPADNDTFGYLMENSDVESNDPGEDRVTEKNQTNTKGGHVSRPQSTESRSSCSTKQANMESSLNARVISNCQNILKNDRNGIWAEDFLRKYQEQYGYSLDVLSYGYGCVAAFVKDNPSIFHTVSCGRERRLKLFDAKIPKEEIKKPSVPNDVITNIGKLLGMYPDGIDLNDVLQVYGETFGEEIQLSQFNLESMDELLEYLEDVVEVVPVDSGYRLYKEPQETPNSVPAVYERIVTLPSGVCDENFRLGLQELPADIGCKRWISIIACEVFSPYRFYVYLYDNYPALRKLMNDMADFYNKHEDEYKMPPHYICPNILCVVKYERDNCWYRARVRKVKEETVSVVMFDYGTEDQERKKSEVLFLLKEFAGLPCQALRTRLLGVRPHPYYEKDGSVVRFWKQDAIDAVLDFIGPENDRCLWIKVANFDLRTRNIEGYLIDTTLEERDIYLHKELIRLKYAEAASEEESSKIMLQRRDDTHEGPQKPEIAIQVPLQQPGTSNAIPETSQSQMPSILDVAPGTAPSQRSSSLDIAPGTAPSQRPSMLDVAPGTAPSQRPSMLDVAPGTAPALRPSILGPPPGIPTSWFSDTSNMSSSFSARTPQPPPAPSTSMETVNLNQSREVSATYPLSPYNELFATGVVLQRYNSPPSAVTPGMVNGGVSYQDLAYRFPPSQHYCSHPPNFCNCHLDEEWYYYSAPTGAPEFIPQLQYSSVTNIIPSACYLYPLHHQPHYPPQVMPQLQTPSAAPSPYPGFVQNLNSSYYSSSSSARSPSYEDQSASEEVCSILQNTAVSGTSSIPDAVSVGGMETSTIPEVVTPSLQTPSASPLPSRAPCPDFVQNPDSSDHSSDFSARSSSYENQLATESINVVSAETYNISQNITVSGTSSIPDAVSVGGMETGTIPEVVTPSLQTPSTSPLPSRAPCPDFVQHTDSSDHSSEFSARSSSYENQLATESINVVGAETYNISQNITVSGTSSVPDAGSVGVMETSTIPEVSNTDNSMDLVYQLETDAGNTQVSSVSQNSDANSLEPNTHDVISVVINPVMTKIEPEVESVSNVNNAEVTSSSEGSATEMDVQNANSGETKCVENEVTHISENVIGTSDIDVKSSLQESDTRQDAYFVVDDVEGMGDTEINPKNSVEENGSEDDFETAEESELEEDKENVKSAQEQTVEQPNMSTHQTTSKIQKLIRFLNTLYEGHQATLLADVKKICELFVSKDTQETGMKK